MPTPFPHRNAFSLADYVSLKGGVTLDVRADYGAKGDGTTDDGPAFRLALLDAVTLNATLRIPFSLAGYRIASLDPAYSTAGSGRRAIDIKPLSQNKRLTIKGESALVIFDFPLNGSTPSDELYCMILNGTAGSFSELNIDGVTFQVKNGATSARATILKLGQCDTGTCSIAGTAVTRLTGPSFTSDMIGQFVSLGPINPTFEQGNAWLLSDRVGTSADGRTVTGTGSPGFVAAMVGSSVTINGVTTTVDVYTSPTSIHLAFSVGASLVGVTMKSSFIYSPNGVGTASGTTFTASSGSAFQGYMVGWSIYIGGAKRTIAGYTSATVVTLDSAITATGASWQAGWRPFTADMAGRTVALYWNNYAIASVGGATYFNLATPISFPTGNQPNYQAVLQMFPSYAVTAFTDASHVTVNAGAGTTSSTPWNFTRPSLGRLNISNCTFLEGHNQILGGGALIMTVQNCKFGYTGSVTPAAEPYSPFVSIWTNNDRLSSYTRYTVVDNCDWDGCLGTAGAHAAGADGFVNLAGSGRLTNCTVRHNAYEAVFWDIDAACGPGTPANIIKPSILGNINIDGTPPPGGSAATTVGIRIDCSDFTGSNVNIVGCMIGINQVGPYRQAVSATIHRTRFRSIDIYLPSSYESGVALSSSEGTGIACIGVYDSSYTDIEITQAYDYSKFVNADAIFIAQSGTNRFVNVAIRSLGKYTTGAMPMRGAHLQQTYGTTYFQQCSFDGMDFGFNSGNTADLTDSPTTIVIGHRWAGCTQNSSGNLSAWQMDNQALYFAAPSTGWYRFLTQYGNISGKLRIWSDPADGNFYDTTIFIDAQAYQGAGSSPSPFLQTGSLGGLPIDKLRVSQAQDSAGYVSLDIRFTASGIPMLFSFEANKVMSALFDPPFQSVTLSIGCTSGDTFLTVSNSGVPAAIPSAGVTSGTLLLIGTEIVHVNIPYPAGGGFGPRLFVTRGAAGTTAASHAIGDALTIIAGDAPAYCTLTAGERSSARYYEGSAQKISAQVDAGGDKIVVSSPATGSLFEVTSKGNNSTALQLTQKTASAVVATLNSAVSAGSTTVTVTVVSGSTPAATFLARLNNEVVSVTGISGSVWTISALVNDHARGEEIDGYSATGWQVQSENSTHDLKFRYMQPDGTWLEVANIGSGGLLYAAAGLATNGTLKIYGVSFATLAALSNTIFINGDYTGNAALVAYMGSLSAANSANAAAIAAKPIHGGAISGTANLTTGVVTGTIT